MESRNYIAPVYKNGKWGYINQQNELLIPFQFDDADVFAENMATVNTGGRLNQEGWLEGGRWGAIDPEGKYIIKPSWELLNPFSCGRACFRLIDRWGFIDASGAIIVEPVYAMAEDYSDNLAVVQNKDHLYGYLDINGATAIDFSFSFAYSFKEGLGVAEQAGSWIVMDTQGRIILRPQVRRLQQFVNGMAGAMDVHRKSGFINREGEWIAEPSFDEVGWFQESLAPVSQKGQWGFIDDKGSMVIPFLFNRTSHFSDGVAPVMQNKLWGIINHSGNWIVKPGYEYIYPCTGGLLSFMSEGKAGYMDKMGNMVIPPVYDDAKPFVEVVI